MRALPTLFRSSRYSKALYMEVMALLYVLLSKARREGILFLEKEIADPAASSVFSQYPRIPADPAMMEFLTDYLRMMVNGNMNAFEIEALMDHEIETFRHEAEVPGPRAVARRRRPARLRHRGGGDGRGARAGLGRPASRRTGCADRARHGRYLPRHPAGLRFRLAAGLAHRAPVSETVKMYECIKVTLLASLNGYAPLVAVEFGRKVLFSSERPSFLELDDHVREVKSLT